MHSYLRKCDFLAVAQLYNLIECKDELKYIFRHLLFSQRTAVLWHLM